MKGGLGQFGKIGEDEENEKFHKMSKYIVEMDEELRERFKALKALQDLIYDADEEEQKEIRKLELQYEEKYKEIYDIREQVINGKVDIQADLVKEFDHRMEQVKDDDYNKIEITPCDVKAIQNIPKGVCDFWMKALINHSLGHMITEKDRPILGYLLNIELELHPEDKGEGYNLIFTFSENSYFDGTVLKKEMYKKDGKDEKAVGTDIKWKEGCNPTKKKQKKKKKGKKVNVEVKCESFFNIFETIDPEEEEKKKKENPKKDEEEDPDNEIEMLLGESFDVADQIKDELVPLALEYYLGVIEPEEGDDDDDDDEDGGDSDDDKKKKKKKNKNDIPLGPDGKP